MYRFIILLLLFTFSSSYADELTGVVKGIGSSGETAPLPGANIYWMDTKTGTTAGSNGEFSIEKSNQTNKLVVSFTGYGRDTLEIAEGQKFVEAVLQQNASTETITVEGKAQEAVIDKSSTSNQQEITMHGLRKAACCNLSESFQTNAAVDVEVSDAISGAKQIMLLGLNGVYTQIMTEKVPNLRGIAGTFGLNYVPGAWMESILISKGPSSVTTGYESITGQINVEYKKPQEAENFHVNLFSNHTGRFEGDFNANYKINDELSTMLLLHGNTFNQIHDLNNDDFIDLPQNDQVSFMNRWNYMTDDIHTQFGVKGLRENRQGGQISYFSGNENAYGLDINTDRYEAFLKSGIILDNKDYKSLAVIANISNHDQNGIFGRRDYSGQQTNAYLNLNYQFTLEHEHVADQHDEPSAELHHEGHAEDEHLHESVEDHEEHLHMIHDISFGGSIVYDDYHEKFAGLDFSREELVPGLFAEYSLSGLYGFTMLGGIRTDFHNIYGTFITPRLQLKYDFSENTLIRASAGKGFRSANILAENVSLMSSSREFIIDEKLDMEEGWNYGMNFITEFDIARIPFTFSLDFYHTKFVNQVIVDLDRDPGAVYFYNLDGESYSNAFQSDVVFSPFDNFDVTAAYRFNDVKMTFNGELMQKPMVNKHKGFLNLSWTILDAGWNFDYTIQYNGGGRLPATDSNPERYQLPDRFDPYVIMMAQITKEFENFEIYAGSENLTNHRQANPILGADDPFGQYFDSSMIWAPVFGRVIYLGVRVDMKY